MENRIRQKIGYDCDTQYYKKVFGEQFDRTFTDALGVVSDLINDSMDPSEIEVYGHIKEGIQRNLSDRFVEQDYEQKPQDIKQELGNFTLEPTRQDDSVLMKDDEKISVPELLQQTVAQQTKIAKQAVQQKPNEVKKPPFNRPLEWLTPGGLIMGTVHGVGSLVKKIFGK